MNVMGTFQNDAVLRQIKELVRTNQVQEGQLINTKDEWSCLRIPLRLSHNHDPEMKLQTLLHMTIAQSKLNYHLI